MSPDGSVIEPPSKSMAKYTITLIASRPVVTYVFASGSVNRGTGLAYIPSSRPNRAMAARQDAQFLWSEKKGSLFPHRGQLAMDSTQMRSYKDTLVACGFYCRHLLRHCRVFLYFSGGNQDDGHDDDGAACQHIGVDF